MVDYHNLKRRIIEKKLKNIITSTFYFIKNYISGDLISFPGVPLCVVVTPRLRNPAISTKQENKQNLE